MTIVTTATSSGPYTAAAATTFAVTFQSAGEGEVEVTLDDVVQATNLYTFTRDTDGTGEVAFLSAVTGQVMIYSKPVFDQQTAFSRFGAFFPDQINGPLDKAAAKSLYLKERVDTLYPEAARTVADRVGKFVTFDGAGLPVLSSGTGSDAALRADLATQTTGTSLIAHPAGGTLQTQLNKVILSPEQFGANGLQTTDQTAAMEAMMVAARSVGKAEIRLTEGKVYTFTNPFLWGNCRTLRIEGNRAKLMNFRSGALVGFDANYGTFRTPAPMMVNGVEVLTFGAGQGNAVPIMGATVATVEPGATTLTILAGTLEVGEAWVYSHDRFGEGGAPPTPSYLEPVTIVSVVGSTATLLQPTMHRHDARCPELTVGGTPQAGAARCVMLNRNTDGDYRKSIWMDRLEVFDVEFIANPLQTGVVTNGLAGFSGARSIHIEGCKGTNAYVSQAESVKIVNSVWAGQFEIDKMLGDVTIHGGEIDELLAAVGCESLVLDHGLHIHKNLNVAPMRLFHLGDVTINAKNAPGDAYLYNDYAFGSFKTIIDGPTIIVSNVTSDRLLNVNKFNWTPTTITTTTLASSRAAWDASLWKQAIRVGSVFYAGNIPVGEVTFMPTVPSGSLLTGDVQIGYKLLGGSIAAATTLSLPAIADLEIRNPPRLEGPYARQVQSTMGADIVAVGSKLARIRTTNIRETEIVITQKITEFYASGSVMESIGRGFRVGSMEIDVTRVAVSGGAVGMFIGGDQADGTNIGIVTTIDLKTAGRRTLTGTTLSVLGADVLGGAGYGIPAAPIVDVRVNDASRALADGNRAAWRIILKGYFL